MVISLESDKGVPVVDLVVFIDGDVQLFSLSFHFFLFFCQFFNIEAGPMEVL